jgi:selenide,water dikinase
LSPEDLRDALDMLPRPPTDPNVLVGHDTLDDAGVYRVRPDLVLIQTVDFFTPIVDDGYEFGQIAAANAFSDVYAMGGTPKTALNLVCWPGDLDNKILGAILAGGADKAHEAGCALIGGHSIQDEELKYGLAVTGTAHPDHIVTNAAAGIGDQLYLTKPLGTGVLTTALKGGQRSAGEIEEAVVAMKALNGPAMAVALDLGVTAATDITGFGLAGHAVQLADASGVTLQFEATQLPLFADAEELALAGCIPGGGEANQRYYGSRVDVASSVPDGVMKVVFDPQTSGGLLLAIPGEDTDSVVAALQGADCRAARHVGLVVARDEPAVVVT